MAATNESGAWGVQPHPQRVAAVTGASAGVGREIAVALGALGWTVGIGARREDRLAETADAVAAAGGTPVVHRLDVTDEASVDAFFDAVEAEAGPVEALVNNAGVGYLGAVADVSVERLRAIVDTNLLGVLLCTRRATARMLDAGIPGDVVFISSDSIQKPYPHMLPYGATKAAVEYLAMGLDVELSGSGIRVATVRLGPTVSEFNTSWPDEDLIVSPAHRMLVKGAKARALFNTDEVLVAARDLIDDARVVRDHNLTEVTYVHLMLPRHEVVFANGLETESFHPAGAAFESLADEQRDRLSALMPGLETDPMGYGDYARRSLSRAEAALLTSPFA